MSTASTRIRRRPNRLLLVAVVLVVLAIYAITIYFQSVLHHAG